MVDRETFDRRLAKLEELLRDLRGLGGTDLPAFRSNRAVLAAAERWLQLACECVLDLAHHLIADRGWKTPASNREALRTLGREGVVAEETALQMERWAGLRNVLVHLYLDVRPEILYEILTRDLDQLERFAAEIRRATEAPLG